MLEREKQYLWVLFCALGLVIILVIGLSYYYWKKRRMEIYIRRKRLKSEKHTHEGSNDSPRRRSSGESASMRKSSSPSGTRRLSRHTPPTVIVANAEDVKSPDMYGDMTYKDQNCTASVQINQSNIPISTIEATRKFSPKEESLVSPVYRSEHISDQRRNTNPVNMEITLPSIESNISLESLHQYINLPENYNPPNQKPNLEP